MCGNARFDANLETIDVGIGDAHRASIGPRILDERGEVGGGECRGIDAREQSFGIADAGAAHLESLDGANIGWLCRRQRRGRRETHFEGFRRQMAAEADAGDGRGARMNEWICRQRDRRR